MRDAFNGKVVSPRVASLIIVYSLAKDLAISPLEIYKMPASLVKDLLCVSRATKELEKAELDKMENKMKVRR